MFGLSFGAKKTNTNQTSTVDKTEDVTGTSNQATTGFQAGQTSTTQQGQTDSSGRQISSTTGSQSGATSQTGSQTGTVTSLGADVQKGFADTIAKLLSGGVNDANIAHIANAIGGTMNFNADEFVRNSVLSARTRGDEVLQEQNSARNSQIGGTAATNSMAALLASRGQNDLDASLAGVEANARATAEDIRNKNLTTAVGAQGSLVSQAAGAGDVLKGATQTTDMTTLSQQLNNLLTTQAGDTSTSNTEKTSQNQQQQTLQIIDQLVSALTNQNTHTTGTENVKGNTTNFGGGFSLGF